MVKVNDRVIATITKNGLAINFYEGIVCGFTKDGRVKVKSYRGIKCHAESNISILQYGNI